MEEPESKQELLELCSMSYIQLVAYISSLCGDEHRQELTKEKLNRRIKNILAHLYQWHLVFLEWHRNGAPKNQNNKIPVEIRVPSTLQLSMETQKKCAEANLKEIVNWLNSSYREVQQVISTYSDEELFEQHTVEWNGKRSLGAYLNYITSRHYTWVYKTIKND